MNIMEKNVVKLHVRTVEVNQHGLLKKSRTEYSKEFRIIPIYSAIKINANLPALYSMLNPETNSDSPSAKSNGVRFVSARIVVNHIIVRGKKKRAFIDRDMVAINVKSSDACRMRGDIRISANLTS